MDRITRKVGDGVVFPSELVGVCMEPSNLTMYKILTRLAEYEDTGLTPDEVEHLIIFEMAKAVAEITEFDGVPIQRLKELAAADKSGNVDIVRRVHWIKRGCACGENEYACSECHETEWRTSSSRMKWCMFCGAKMDGGGTTMARWMVFEHDTPQCSHCGMWAPFARYRRGQGTDANAAEEE